MKSQTASLPSNTLPSDPGEKQLLLDCLLQDPKRSWLHYLDGRQALGIDILLHLGRLSLPPEEFPQSPHGKA
ncbi:MAG: hypothetical protein WCD57_11455 [Acidobacteriaceae bacterium]